MPNSWNDLKPWLIDATALSNADPYLRMADGTHYADHLTTPPGGAADITFPVSVELKAAATRPVLVGMTVPLAYPIDSPFFTATVTAAALNALLVDPAVARLQFADGVLPQRPRIDCMPPWPVSPTFEGIEGPPAPTDLLLGVIDDGCPFAHTELRRPDRLRTRVVGLWDQDGAVGTPPASMGYGSELDEAQLNRVMALATDAQGSIDEHRCYLRAGCEHVLGRTSHGAHALGLLAALRRHAGNPQSLLHPPVYEKAGEASAADIAFVQLPSKVLDAPFPPAVEHWALDGLRYLLQAGLARGARRVWVSFAFESWLGPHDDTNWFSLAVADLARQANLAGIELRVFTVAGNGGASNVHLRVTDEPQPPGSGRQALVHWQLPPDNQCVTHIEIWVPDAGGGLDSLTLEVGFPDGSTLPALTWGHAVAWPQVNAAALCVVVDRSRTLGRKANVAVLRLSPSRVFDARQRPAPHGEWSVKLTADSPLNGVDVYIGRGTENFRSPRRGRQTVLARRSVDEKQQDRRGTLNGHSNHPTAIVATSSVAMSCIYNGQFSPLKPGRAAPYAGFGPSRDGARVGPDFAVAVEHGIYHAGCIGIGNRSATTFRLIGTSAAAPLGARMKLDHDPCDPGLPTIPSPAELEEIGLCTFVPF